MSTTTPSARTHVALTSPARLTLRLLIAAVAWLLVMRAAVERSLPPPIGIIQALLLAVPASMIIRHIRGGLLTATIIAGLILLGAIPFSIADLSQPSAVVTFAWNVAALPLFTVLPFVAFQALWSHRVTDGYRAGDATPARRPRSTW